MGLLVELWDALGLGPAVGQVELWNALEFGCSSGASHLIGARANHLGWFAAVGARFVLGIGWSRSAQSIELVFI